MNAFLTPAGRPATCAPLTLTRDLETFSIGNRPLRSHQLELLAAQGFGQTDTLASAHLVVHGASWLSPADLAALLAAPSPAVIVAASGHLLAWTSPTDAAPDYATKVAAGPDSFAIVYPWDLLRAHEAYLNSLKESNILGTVSPLASIGGPLLLGKGSVILPGVVTEGPVVVGENCKLGPNCYLRGGVSLGDNCHIGNAVELKNCLVLGKTNIGHLSYAGDSVIGEKCNFGAGTIVSNLRHDGGNHRSMVGGTLVDTGRRKFGTVFGDGVKTGIQTGVYGGRKIWPGLSTLPGQKVDRDIRDS